MNIAETIKQHIDSALAELGVADVSYMLEHPGELSHGDYACNVAMVAAKKLGKNPRELADIIAAKLADISMIEKVEVAGPGFINFYLAPNFYAESLKDVLEKSATFGKSEMWAGKKILVEHSSPNLFKPFHIGHVMNNAIGESAARLAAWAGADVTVISYPSDVSLGIGKAVWSLMGKGIEKLETFKTLQEKLDFLGQCYVDGTRAYEEDESIQPRVREITKKIFDKTDGPEYAAYLVGRNINLEYFKDMTARLGSQFADFIYESEAGVAGKEIVLKNTPGVFTESDGAVIYEGEQDGLHTRVFINKENYPTYEAKDIGLLSIKFDRFNPDVSALVTDHEQREYYKVVLSAAGKINKNWQEKSVHLTHGRMSFKGQKMSSRLGGVPTAAGLFEVIHDEVSEKNPDATDELKDMIAIAALKFTILKSQAGKNINFDPETSLSFEGDSGPYLQYTHARCSSLIEKGKTENISASSVMPNNWEITNIERLLYRFPEVVEQSATLWEPHHVAGYLIELAREFNSFYGNTKIVDRSDETAPYKLALTQAVGQVIKNGLFVLGIEAPERM